MLDAIFSFFQGIADAFTNFFNSIKMFFDTLVIVPTLAPWFVSHVPTVFAVFISIGVVFIIIKIIKDLL